DRLDALARRAASADLDLDAGRDHAAVASFVESMEDDLGTPKAMATVFDLVGRANAALDSGDQAAGSLAGTAVELAMVLGLELDAGEVEADPEIDALVARRQEARAAKDFAEADAIRDQLQAMGIEVEDTAAGPVWRRL
ncbi:MAG: DALR domain-containing protein, partial [Actinomycetota bacterium]